uniref:Right handed beta helix domain-containing protein n=1 Tax=Anopheles atroparvus TaxID=41427 RepID=A0AAG5DHU2_ANOAO
MEPSRYRGYFAVFLLLFGAAYGEQEQLEQVVREPLRCERIDGAQGRLANEDEWRFLGGRAGDRLLLCDCQDSQRSRRRNRELGREDYDHEQQLQSQQQPAFILPAFESTTVATDIVVANCHQLLVPTGTFRALRAGFLPRTVRFVDIDQLTVESFAFETSGAPTGAGMINNVRDRHPVLGPIALRFERCQLEELPANVFHGAALRSVQFVGTTIGVIRSLAVGIRLNQFRIADSVIGRFGRHSFKRAQMEQLQLHNVTMLDAWPSQAWQGLIVSESMRITNSTFLQTVHPAAIMESTTDDLIIEHNVFNQSIADEAFQLAVKTRIWLIGNVFGQLSSNLFRGVVISNETAWNAQPNILLERNLIETFTVSSGDARNFLVIPRNFSLNVQGFRIAQLATCENTNISSSNVWPEVFFLRPFAVTNRDDPESYVSVEEFRQEEGCDAGGPDLVLVIVLATL